MVVQSLVRDCHFSFPDWVSTPCTNALKLVRSRLNNVPWIKNWVEEPVETILAFSTTKLDTLRKSLRVRL